MIDGAGSALPSLSVPRVRAGISERATNSVARRSLRRRSVRFPLTVLALLAVTVMFWLGSATGASAAPCSPEAPTPEGPTQGVAGFFMPDPTAKQLAAEENPFAKNAKITPFEEYGLAGLRWKQFDLGCGGSVRDPSGSISFWVGNTLFVPAKALISLVVAALGAAFNPTFLQAFDPLLQNLTDSLHNKIFLVFAPIAIGLTGLLIMARSSRQRVSETTNSIAGIMAVIFAAAIVTVASAPTVASKVDKAISGTVGVVAQAFSPDGGNSDSSDEDPSPPQNVIASQIHSQFLYPVWLMGEFCDSNSIAARVFGADLFQAQALNWHDAHIVATDPAFGGIKIVDKKGFLGNGGKFADTAKKIKDADPIAYECVAGHSDSPLEAAILGNVGAIAMAPFLLIGAFILIAAYIILRFAIILSPILFVVSLYSPLRWVAQGAARMVAAAMINGIVFIIASLLVVNMDSTILTASEIPMWMKLLLIGVVTVLMWYLTRPFRKLTTMVSPSNYAAAIQTPSGIDRLPGRMRQWVRREQPHTTIINQPQSVVAKAGDIGRAEAMAQRPVMFTKESTSNIRVQSERIGKAAPGLHDGAAKPELGAAAVRRTSLSQTNGESSGVLSSGRELEKASGSGRSVPASHHRSGKPILALPSGVEESIFNPAAEESMSHGTANLPAYEAGGVFSHTTAGPLPNETEASHVRPSLNAPKNAAEISAETPNKVKASKTQRPPRGNKLEPARSSSETSPPAASGAIPEAQNDNYR